MIKFGTNGFRAIMNEEFTKENVQKITQALANMIKKEGSTKPVVIGYDRRFMSDTFAKWSAEVLAGNNIKTLLSSVPLPTPAAYYEVKKLDLDYGIIITASHNPYFYNGYKICVRGGKDAPTEFTDVLEKLSNKTKKIKSIEYDIAIEKGLVELFDNSKDYVKNLEKFVSKNLKGNKTKVLFNPMYGVTSDIAKIFAKTFKLDNLDVVNSENDPYFNHTLPCPHEEYLEDFKKQISKGKYKIGFACDADGDRLGIIDDQGTFYSSNIIMAIVYYYLIKYRNLSGDIVKTYPTSYILDKLADKFGYKCHEVPVGIKWVSKKMEETDALLGGESSGGFTVRGFTPTKDSMLAISLLFDAMATIKKPLAKIAEEVKEFCGYQSTYIEKSMRVADRKAFEKKMKKEMPNFSYKPVKVVDTDGMKYYFEDNSWVQIRFSGTENLLRYYMEFSTEIECERNLKAIENFIAPKNKKNKK